MKHNKFLWGLGLFAALSLTACSDNDVVDDNGGQNSPFGPDGTGYINVSINLPTRGNKLTRAENDQFSDGLPSEYEVKDGTLFIFAKSGSSEGDYKFVSANTLDLVMANNSDAQITVNNIKIQENPGLTSNNLYALVILNNNGIYDATNGKFGNITLSATAGSETKFSDLLAETASWTGTGANKLYSSTGGFFMANAVLTTTAGTTGNTTALTNGTAVGKTLCEIDDSKIYETKQAAEAGEPAVEVWVERAVAKVEVATSDANNTFTPTNGSGLDDGNGTAITNNKLRAVVTDWKIANIRPSSMVLKNWNNDNFQWKSNGTNSYITSNPYRFAGTDDIPNGTTPLYRTYYSICPSVTTWPFTQQNTDFAALSGTGAKTYDYCYENTFPVEHMQVKNTTAVVFKVKYQLSTDNGVNYSDLTTDQHLYRVNEDYAHVYLKSGVENVVKTKAMSLFPLKTVFGDEATGYVKISSVTFGTTNTSTGIAPITALIFQLYSDSELNNKVGSDVTWESSDKTSEFATLNEMCEVREYNQGVSYYTVLIKHFGAELTPWGSEAGAPTGSTAGAQAGNSTVAAYGWSTTDTDQQAVANNNYLGRYSLVRNNWYLISVNGISQLGDAVDPTDHLKSDDTPDDHKESYIKAKINILSWAKRTQNETLK